MGTASRHHTTGRLPWSPYLKAGTGSIYRMNQQTNYSTNFSSSITVCVLSQLLHMISQHVPKSSHSIPPSCSCNWRWHIFLSILFEEVYLYWKMTPQDKKSFIIFTAYYWLGCNCFIWWYLQFPTFNTLLFNNNLVMKQ